MGQPLFADHGENGFAFTNITWLGNTTEAFFNYYKNRAVSPGGPELYGVFKFFSAGDNGFQDLQGTIQPLPWDGDYRQPKDLSSSCSRDILGLDDIPPRSSDALLMTVQDVPWTWALNEHKIRLTLDGLPFADFKVYFPDPLDPIYWTGTWTLERDYR